MSLVDQINSDIKDAMRAKEKEKLAALRAVKSALLIAATEKGADGQVSDETATKVLQKQVKQRKESADAFTAQGRDDMAQEELTQASYIEAYLPEQMSEAEIEAVIAEIISSTGAEGMKDMGKVMGAASGALAGKADNKLVAQIVKAKLG